jgi:CheY-like chemotaxis protein
VSLCVVGDGDQAVTYLEGSGQYNDRHAYPLPSLILLDLKLPKLSGLEVLQWIRQRPSLVRTPVVVLTSSAEDDDIKQAYEYGANSFLQKPVAFTGLVQLLGVLDLYWLQTNIGSSRTGTSD